MELLAEHRPVLLRNTEQVGDHEKRERTGEVTHDLAGPTTDELVDLPIGERPHELLVLLQALRCDQTHEQPAMRLVHRRVHRRKLVAERQFVAMLLDQLTDVVTLERDREAGERARDRVARRERVDVVVHGQCLVVPGHHHDVVVLLAPDGALLPEEVEVRIRVLDQRLVAEEVDRVEVGHRGLIEGRRP